MRTAAAALACFASASASGCLALSVRTHVGAVTSDVGSGIQAGLTLGIGLPINKRAAVIESVGAVTGNAPQLGIAAAFDYVRLPDHEDPVKLAWRAGLGGEYAFTGQPSLIGLHFAGMFVVRDRFSTDRGSEKFGHGGWDRSIVGVGLEGQIGLAMRWHDDPMAAASEPMQPDSAVGASIAITAEWMTLLWTDL